MLCPACGEHLDERLFCNNEMSDCFRTEYSKEEIEEINKKEF